jgi:hypothetical protein
MASFRHILLATLLVSASAFAEGEKTQAELGGTAGEAMKKYRVAYDELQKVGPTNKLYFCVYQKTSYTMTPEQVANQVNPAEIAKRIGTGNAMAAGLVSDSNPNHENMQTPASITGNFIGMASNTMYVAMRETLEYTRQIRFESREHTAEECAKGQANMEASSLSVSTTNYDCTVDLPKISAQEKIDSAKYARLSTCFSHLVTRTEYVQKKFHTAFDNQKFMDTGTCAGTTEARDTVGKDLDIQHKSLADLAQIDSDKSKTLADHAAQLSGILKTCGTAKTVSSTSTDFATTSTITGDPAK